MPKHADQCIQDILDGTARESRSGYPVVVRNQSGTPFLPNQLLERYLSRLPLRGFPYEEAVTFCDALRPEDVDAILLRFTCHMAYGASYESITVEHYFGLVFQLCPVMAKELKNNGSGKLPPESSKEENKAPERLSQRRLCHHPITARDNTEGCCAEALGCLYEWPEQPAFPRNYSVEFRGPEISYLPKEADRDKKMLAYLWRDVLWAIWSRGAENGGSKVIQAAPEKLKERYQQVFV